jgi:hypothetical protein
VFQYPEGSPMPADAVLKPLRRLTVLCFNTPKGHLCLQTRSYDPRSAGSRRFNTPKGHLCLQTPNASLTLTGADAFQYPEGSPMPADTVFCNMVGHVLWVSIPRRVTYACRRARGHSGRVREKFQYPEGSPMPADMEEYVFFAEKAFQYPEGSPMPADSGSCQAHWHPSPGSH